MFHLEDNLFFGRRADGSVRILKFTSPPLDFPQADADYPDAVLDKTVDTPSWASVVCSVSKGGETSTRWEWAQNFHGR